MLGLLFQQPASVHLSDFALFGFTKSISNLDLTALFLVHLAHSNSSIFISRICGQIKYYLLMYEEL